MFIRIVISLTWRSIEHLFIEHNVKKLVQFFNMAFYVFLFLEHNLKILDQYLKTLDFYKIPAILYTYSETVRVTAH
jgi:hypothetical protein